MVVVQVAFAGVNIFYKLAANDGMSLRVIIAYRLIFATVLMFPLALILERGSLSQNLFVESLVLTSATFASAMFNLIPAVTFVLATSIGLEKLGIRTRAGKAKLLGTLIGISGAMLLTLYKGVEIKIWSTHVDLLHHAGGGGHVASVPLQSSDTGKRLLGSLLALGSCFSYALWLIIQAKLSEEYPCQYSSTALMCVMGAIQAVAFALCMEKNWDQWKLGWNIRLVTVAYSGIVASGFMVTLISWCVRVKGPLFASVFSPMMLVVVALAASLILDEMLHLGSLLGATLIVCGLYSVLWGKGKEMKNVTQLAPGAKTSKDSEPIKIVIGSPIDDSRHREEDHIFPKENKRNSKGDRD
ncbi:WAT1-related protein [Citrus sinensis]|uniref:WAT1-related protein n=1 Tax=Citrus sinensis TaxID=2711 RepID=A0ACB8KCK6_CITSI|nr:WAT1-related protein [Citrus sinensis]